MSALRRWLREERMRDLDGILIAENDRSRVLLARGRCPSCERGTAGCICLDFGPPVPAERRVCAAIRLEAACP